MAVPHPSQMGRFTPCSLEFSHSNGKLTLSFLSIKLFLMNSLANLTAIYPKRSSRCIQIATGVKGKVSWCYTPPRALHSSYNPNHNTHTHTHSHTHTHTHTHTKTHRDKIVISIKPFVKKIEQKHVTKNLAITCLSKFDREIIRSP